MTEQQAQVTWENVDQNGPAIGTMRRARVPNGWLVAIEESLTFVPDANHDWKSDTAAGLMRPRAGG